MCLWQEREQTRAAANAGAEAAAALSQKAMQQVTPRQPAMHQQRLGLQH